MSKAIIYYCDLCNSQHRLSGRGVLVDDAKPKDFDWLTVRRDGITRHVCLYCREEGKTRKDIFLSIFE